MSWCWFAMVDDPAAPEGSLAHATASDADGARVGTLAVWPPGRKPVAGAVRMDDRVVDPDGTAAWVSLVLLARDRSPLFDDPAVSGALRRVLAGPPPDGVSTLVRDSSHFAGAVTVRRGPPTELRADPFAGSAMHRCCTSGAGCSAARQRCPVQSSSATAASPGLPRASDGELAWR